MAADLSDSAVESLGAYARLHENVVSQSFGADGLTKSVILTHFNDSYCYGNDVRTAYAGSVMMYSIRKDIETFDTVAEQYFKRVLNLCLRSDICQKLNMSMVELMSVDYPTFELIEREFYKHKPAEQDIAAELQRELEREATAKHKRS